MSTILHFNDNDFLFEQNIEKSSTFIWLRRNETFLCRKFFFMNFFLVNFFFGNLVRRNFARAGPDSRNDLLPERSRFDAQT